MHAPPATKPINKTIFTFKLHIFQATDFCCFRFLILKYSVSPTATMAICAIAQNMVLKSRQLLPAKSIK